MVVMYDRLGGVILANTRTQADQSGPGMAVTGTGGFVVVWTDSSLLGGDASDSAVKGQRFDAGGGRIGSEFLVNSTTAGFQYSARVAVLSSGRFVATWIDSKTVDGVSVDEVRARLFNADATPVGTDFIVNTTRPDLQNQPMVTALSGGGFVVTWTDWSRSAEPGSLDIRAQLFDAAGARVGGEFVVNSTTAAGQSDSSVAALSSGGFVVGWTDSSQTGGDTSRGAVRLQLFSATGAKIGGEKLVNSVTADSQSASSLTALEGGGFLAVWTDASRAEDPYLTAVKGQLFDAGGQKVGGEFLVNTIVEGAQRRPRASALDDGGFIVTWESLANSDPGGLSIKAQIFTADGRKSGAEFAVTPARAGNQSTQNLVVLPSGEIVVGWTDATGGGGDVSGLAVRVQLLAPTDAAPTDIALSAAAVSETAVTNLPFALLTASGALTTGFTYAIVSDSTGGAFRIERDRLVVADNVKLDFETAPHPQIRLRATDIAGNSYEETLTLTVTDAAVERRYEAGGAFMVNAPFTGFNTPTAVTPLASGGFLVVTSFLQLGLPDPSGLRGRIYDAAGRPIAAEFDIEVSNRLPWIDAAVALPNGGFLLVYEGNHVDAEGGFPIRAQMFDAAGKEVGSELLVSSTNEWFVQNPAAAILESGRIVITWQLARDEDAGGDEPFPSQVVAQLFDASGNRIGAEFRVNQSIAGAQDAPNVVAVAGGGFLITWHDSASEGFKGQFFNKDGGRVGGEFPIVSGEDGLSNVSGLAVLESGNLLVTWVASGEARGIVLGPTGVRLGQPFVIAEVSHVPVEIAATPDGGFVAAWNRLDETSPGGDDRDAYARFFDGSGAPAGDAFLVTPSAADDETALKVASLASGSLVFAWARIFVEGGSSTSDAYGRILTPVLNRIEGTELADTLTGTAEADDMRGYGGDDTLNGGGGGDRIDGGSGADRMRGGIGDDSYSVAQAGDAAIESAGEGTDTVRSSVTFVLGANVEHLVLVGTGAIRGTGNVLANRITGNGAANSLDGGAGNDILDGAAGTDTMAGGTGNDTYVVDNAADKAIETSATGGTDLVRSAVTFTLGANVENLLLTGSAAINGTGNGLANTVTGNDGANILNGAAGADTMAGGAGNDTYVVDNAADKAIETSATGGTDLVRSAVTFTLGANVENLLLTGSAAINGTGNGLANGLTGNGGANILDGAAGADTMAGGAGNDTYVVDSWTAAPATLRDNVVELANAGNDRVHSSVSYVLPANVERLVLTGAALSATGNSLANSLTGNAAANRIDGGLGADTMRGGGGDDVFVVDNWSGGGAGDDTVIEYSGGGTDTVESEVGYRLPNHVENLVLTGTSALNGTGNFHANAITGNDGANILRGADNADVLIGGLGNDRLYGGAGKDTLQGGGGADGFYFDTALSAAGNVDKLVGFNTAADTIFLDRDVFTGIAVNGTLAATAFRSGPAAGDASDRIIYQQSTGKIFYDPDGTGPEAQILFATVTVGTALTSADFSAFI